MTTITTDTQIDRDTELAQQMLRLESLEAQLREARWASLLAKPLLVTALRTLGRVAGAIGVLAFFVGPVAVVVFAAAALFGSSVTWQTVGNVVGYELLALIATAIIWPYMIFTLKLSKRVKAQREQAATEA